MDKSELRFNNLFIEEWNKQKKENYLRDFQDSFRNYSKTGIKNEVLTMFSDYESEFKKKYNMMWSEIQQNNIMEQMEYMCYIKIMYDLFHKKQKVKKIEEQYWKFHGKYPDLIIITQKISEKRRMYLKELETSRNWKISIKDIINECKQFFYLKERKDGILVSLTATGINYNNFISSKSVGISYDIVNQIVYNNSNNILDSLKKSLDSEIIHSLNLEEIEAEKKRAIEHKYRFIVSDILSQQKEYYEIKIKYNERKTENYYDSGKKFRIPSNSYYEVE